MLIEYSVRAAKLLGFCFVAFGLPATSAVALTINDSFETSLSSNPNAAAYENAIEQASNTLAALYSNPITVNILFGYNSSDLGQSQTGVYQTPYSAYASLLATNSVANPANNTLATAITYLNTGNGGTAAAFNAPIFSTSANLRALGVTTATGFYNSAGTFVPGGGQQYDGIVTIGSVSTASNGPGYNSQAVDIVEHEINEILGGGGSGSTLGSFNQFQFCLQDGCGGYGPLDLYRYHATGASIATVTSTGSYTTASSEVAAFSVNGGQTALAQFNQAGGGSDYGDFAFTGTPEIQDAFYGSPTQLYTTSSVEYAMMESIGYDPTTVTPLPATLPLFVGGLGFIGFLSHRRTRIGI